MYYQKLTPAADAMTKAQSSLAALVPLLYMGDGVGRPTFRAVNDISMLLLRCAYVDLCGALEVAPNAETMDQSRTFSAPSNAAKFVDRLNIVTTFVMAACQGHYALDARPEYREAAAFQVKLAKDRLEQFIEHCVTGR